MHLHYENVLKRVLYQNYLQFLGFYSAQLSHFMRHRILLLSGNLKTSMQALNYSEICIFMENQYCFTS